MNYSLETHDAGELARGHDVARISMRITKRVNGLDSIVEVGGVMDVADLRGSLSESVAEASRLLGV